MYAYLKGTITAKSPDHLILEQGGIGYEINLTHGIAERLPALGQAAQVWVYLHVREDQMTLYGFSAQEEKQLFLQLLTVTGIGPRVATTIIGSMTPGAFALAILGSDVRALTQIKGVGKKSAERLILELKDKLRQAVAVEDLLPDAAADLPADADEAAEAISALVVLGYNRTEAARVVSAVLADGTTQVEEVIVQSLQRMSRL